MIMTIEDTCTAADGLALRNAAMNRADSAANPAWKAAALESVREVALAKEFLTVDDIQELLATKGVSTHENRAMGPVLLRAQKQGWIVNTRRTVLSRQAHCHANPRSLWQSSIFGSSPATN